uniref:Uncharacterized protein n=1 Tax=Globodera rostochiensis TaxID=31243 RepID=A0A914HA86_GLORO
MCFFVHKKDDEDEEGGRKGEATTKLCCAKKTGQGATDQNLLSLGHPPSMSNHWLITPFKDSDRDLLVQTKRTDLIKSNQIQLEQHLFCTASMLITV